MDISYKIDLNLDKDRIKTVLGESYRTCKDTLGVEFDIDEEVFVSKIDPYLNSNRVSTVIVLDLPSKKYPELKIEVDPRKKSVIARMFNKKIRVHLNRYLTQL